MKRLWVILPLLFIFSCEDKKDTTPPEVTITSPSSGSTVNEVVTVTCMSTDNKGVEKVELWIDGVNTGLTDDTDPYSFQWNATNDYGDPVGAGVYLYQLQAKDFVKTRKMMLLK